MLFWVRQRLWCRSRVAGPVTLAAYAVMLVAASAVIVYATPKIVYSAIVQLDAATLAAAPKHVAVLSVPVMPEPHRAARLVLTSDWLDRLEFPKFWKSRGKSGALFDFDDEEDAEKVSGTFRTMCVRLCDGYYWPVSFSTTPERFQRDAGVCQSSCAAPARLFVYGNPGQDLTNMKDLSGRRYSSLPAASKFKTSYNPSCSCKAQPWQQASKTRHQMYALARKKQRTRGRSARRKLASELRSIRRLVRVQERQFRRTARQAHRVAAGKPSIEPVEPVGVVDLKLTKLSPIRRVNLKSPPVRQAPVLRGANLPTAAPRAGLASPATAKIVQQPTVVASRLKALRPPMGLGAQVKPVAAKIRTHREPVVRRSTKRRRGWKRAAFSSDSE